MKKLLIIDKDQTLIRSRLGGDEFVQKPWDQVSIEGMAYKDERMLAIQEGGTDKQIAKEPGVTPNRILALRRDLYYRGSHGL